MTEPTKRIPLNSGDEYDGLTRWKIFINWRAGERKRIKRIYNKRFRRVWKQLLKKERIP